MNCTDCRWYKGEGAPARNVNDEVVDCACPIGIGCPDEDAIDRAEMRTTSVEWANDVRGFNDGPDW